MNQKHTKSKLKDKARYQKKIKKDIDKKTGLIKKKFIIKRKLFDKGIFAAMTMSILLMIIAIVLIVVSLWWIGLIIMVVTLFQLLLSGYMFYQLHWGFANLETIFKFKKSWLLFLITGNITGAIYIGLLVTKK